MVIARRELVRGEGTYHCITRCVRRAFLCGFDPYSQKNFDHRKAWIKHRLMQLAEVFAIDVAAYAVMSNHLHVVLRLRPDIAQAWTALEVAQRWSQLFPKCRGPFGKPVRPTDDALEIIANQAELVEIYSERLTSLSWFMRCLNENIARRANREDSCKGRFWEGRFKSIELLDDAAVTACCAYVDLNPVRAGKVQHIENAEYTSIQDRVVAYRARKKMGALKKNLQRSARNKAEPQESAKHSEHSQNGFSTKIAQNHDRDAWLMPFQKSKPIYNADLNANKLPLTFEEYAALLDWTGRQFVDGIDNDKGKIPQSLESLLQRLEIEHDQWLETVSQFGSMFFRVAGTFNRMKHAASRWGQQWLHGNQASRLAFRL